MAVSDAKRRANRRYDSANAKTKVIKFYPPDYDLLEWQASTGEPFATYVKRRLREDMERARSES